MIGYVTIGTNDMAKAAAFYDALLGSIGAKRIWDQDRFKSWQAKPGTPAISVAEPFDGNPATVGNGVMVAIAGKNRAMVDAMHAKALALGGTDEGAPRLRGGVFYGAYFRDLDGNKLCCFLFENAGPAE